MMLPSDKNKLLDFRYKWYQGWFTPKHFAEEINRQINATSRQPWQRRKDRQRWQGTVCLVTSGFAPEFQIGVQSTQVDPNDQDTIAVIAEKATEAVTDAISRLIRALAFSAGEPVSAVSSKGIQVDPLGAENIVKVWWKGNVMLRQLVPQAIQGAPDAEAPPKDELN